MGFGGDGVGADGAMLVRGMMGVVLKGFRGESGGG